MGEKEEQAEQKADFIEGFFPERGELSRVAWDLWDFAVRSWTFSFLYRAESLATCILRGWKR